MINFVSALFLLLLQSGQFCLTIFFLSSPSQWIFFFVSGFFNRKFCSKFIPSLLPKNKYCHTGPFSLCQNVQFCLTIYLSTRSNNIFWTGANCPVLSHNFLLCYAQRIYFVSSLIFFEMVNFYRDLFTVLALTVLSHNISSTWSNHPFCLRSIPSTFPKCCVLSHKLFFKMVKWFGSGLFLLL